MTIFKESLPITFGGAAISGEGGGYGFGNISEQDSITLLKYAFDIGITSFDTAPVYGFNLSEIRIGKAFKACRDKVIITSKCGVTWHDTKRINLTNEPKIAREMLEESLRHLDSDYIDIYMIHWPDKNIDIRKPMEVLAKAKSQGKIKHIGLCNTFPEDIAKANEIENVEVVQNELNLFSRDVTTQLFPYLKENNIEFMGYGTFDKGILTGRVTSDRSYDAADLRSWAPWWKKSDKNKKIKKMDDIKKFSKENNFTLQEIATGHNLSYGEVTTTICGTKTKNQIDSAINSLKNLPTKELIKQLIDIINE